MSAAPFHEGEVALQERAGSRAKLAEIGPRVIRDHMPDQHREFFAQLPFVVAGSVDANGQPWASVMAGPPGFVTSPDPRRLVVRARPLAHDPLAANLAEGMPIGLLGIEPHTRRRNRLNGWVRRMAEHGFEVDVGQSFGNCPKYIQARRPEFTGEVRQPGAAQVLPALDGPACALIAGADTFYIATAHPQAGHRDTPSFGVDVSHRGGKPGFVRVQDDGLTVPDFIGNAFFNTLGNLSLNARCGLLFIDYESGDLLQVAARGEVLHDGPEVRAFQGAQRLMRFHVASVRRLPGALPLRWGAAELSPVLEATGSWT